MLALRALPSGAEAITLHTRQIPLDTSDIGATQAGEFAYRGGLHLTSPTAGFGGLSGLDVSADGSRMTAVSDRGSLFTARLVYDADGSLADADGGDLAPLRAADGRPLSGSRGDGESLAPDGAGGWYVGFERQHRIVQYPANGGSHPLPAPPGAARLPPNGGMEALTRLADGRLLVITEGAGDENRALAWIGGRDGWSALTYLRTGSLRATGAATLPDGSVLVSERSFSPLDGIAARVVHVEAQALRPGAEINGRDVASLRPPLNVDNVEAIAVRRDTAGRTYVYLLSDDNFSFLQRTLLLMFEWRPAGP